MRKIARLAGVKRYKFAPRAINQDLVGVKYRKFIHRAVKARPKLRRYRSSRTLDTATNFAKQTEPLSRDANRSKMQINPNLSVKFKAKPLL